MQPIPHSNAGPTNNTLSSIMDDLEGFLEQGGVIDLRIPLLNHPQNAIDNRILRKITKYTKPKLSTRSTALFLSTLSALLLYFFTFGAVARDVHEAELVIERVRATAGELKDIIVQAASEGTQIKTNFLLLLGGFDYRLEDRTKDGRWEFVPNLHHRWMIFCHRYLKQCEIILLTIMVAFTVAALRIGVIYYRSQIPGVLDLLDFSTSLICLVNSSAYFAKFHGMQSTAMAIEWVATLRPRPEVGVWWDVERLSLPRVYFCWWRISIIPRILDFSIDIITGNDSWTVNPITTFYCHLLIAVLLFFGLGHGLWICVCARSDKKAMEESWKARINAYAFEANNAVPEKKNVDKEMEMVVV